jgi:hypothetical protein
MVVTTDQAQFEPANSSNTPLVFTNIFLFKRTSTKVFSKVFVVLKLFKMFLRYFFVLVKDMRVVHIALARER